MNKRRFLIVEDFPRSARNIANTLSKQLLKDSDPKDFRIDIAHNLSQAAYLLALSQLSPGGRHYDGFIMDYVMLTEDQIIDRLFRERLRWEKILTDGSKTYSKELLDKRIDEIGKEMGSLSLKHFIPSPITHLLSNSENNTRFNNLLNHWNTGPIIRFIRYNFPETPLLICTGKTFEMGKISEELKIGAEEFDSIFQIRFVDKPLLNLHPDLYEKELQLETFVSLVGKEYLSEKERTLSTSDLTTNLEFFNLLLYLIEGFNEQKKEDRVNYEIPPGSDDCKLM